MLRGGECGGGGGDPEVRVEVGETEIREDQPQRTQRTQRSAFAAEYGVTTEDTEGDPPTLEYELRRDDLRGTAGRPKMTGGALAGKRGGVRRFEQMGHGGPKHREA